MSKTSLPFIAKDISALAKSLRRELEQAPQGLPSHVRLLNMLARANGFRNFQHFKASAETTATSVEAPPELQQSDAKAIERAARCFDAQGRLTRWPARVRTQELCVWVMWSRLPARTVLQEPQINDVLNAHHTFGDPATLRRLMIGWKMLTRKIDGSDYLRLETRPPADALALMNKVQIPDAKRLDMGEPV